MVSDFATTSERLDFIEKEIPKLVRALHLVRISLGAATYRGGKLAVFVAWKSVASRAVVPRDIQDAFEEICDLKERCTDREKLSKERLFAARQKIIQVLDYLHHQFPSAGIELEPVKELYVSLERIVELEAIPSPDFDLLKLVRLCEELNVCYVRDCFLSVAMLVRAIIDHVPPIFGCANFSAVANNYRGAKSFKKSMEHLHKSLRNIADLHLHVQIRKSESLPTKVQVNFSADLDLLLAEIVRLLK